MDYIDFNYQIASVQRFQSRVLTTTHGLPTSSRYQHHPTNHRTRKYRIRSAQPSRVNFLSPNPQFRLSPLSLKQKMIYRTSNNPHLRDSSDKSEEWETQWKIFNRIRSLVNWILKIINFLQTRIQEQGAAGHGCSLCCVCVGATATTGLVVVGVGLSLGLGIGIKYNGENTNSTLTSNSQAIEDTSVACISQSCTTLISFFCFLYFLMSNWYPLTIYFVFYFQSSLFLYWYVSLTHFMSSHFNVYILVKSRLSSIVMWSIN
jgi:hypothetical protein